VIGKYWTTKDNQEIKYEDLAISHLRNILKMLERNAESGLRIEYGECGFSADEYYYDSEVVTGVRALELQDYYILKRVYNRKIKATAGGEDE
jgi:hypothetical protein